MYKATIVIPNINGKGWLKDSIESVYPCVWRNTGRTTMHVSTFVIRDSLEGLCYAVQWMS